MGSITSLRQAKESEDLTPTQRYRAVICSLDYLAKLLHAVFTGKGIPESFE